MSKPYRVATTNIGSVIYCGNRPILFTFNNPQFVVDILNKETAPLIDVLETITLENVQLKADNAALQSLIQKAIATVSKQMDFDCHNNCGDYLMKVWQVLHSIEKKEGE